MGYEHVWRITLYTICTGCGPCVPLHTAAGTGRREIAKYNIVTAYREVVVKILENDPELDACEILYTNASVRCFYSQFPVPARFEHQRRRLRGSFVITSISPYTISECTRIIWNSINVM